MRHTLRSTNAVRRRRSVRGFLRATIVAVAAVVVALAPPPTATVAAWTDAEHASGNFQALTVPAPIIDTCTARSVLVNLSLTPRVTLTWHYPSTDYTSANAQYWWSDSGILGLIGVTIGSGVSTTGPVGGVYTSTFQGSLLSGLLGGSADVGLSTGHTSGWSSKTSTAHATFPLLVGTGTCTITNAT